jgi:ATP-dependent Lon protease
MDEVLAAALEENPLGRKSPPAEPEGEKKVPPKKTEEVRV